jgi:stress response protein YsnF
MSDLSAVPLTDLCLGQTRSSSASGRSKAVEHYEEVVVAKEARVTEEIALRKQTEQKTETVADTVRRTEVEIEDDRGNAVGKTARPG